MPKLLNDPPCVAWAEIGQNHPYSASSEEFMQLTTAAEQQTPAEDAFCLQDVRSGVKEAKMDAQCAPSGAEQADETITSEQGTVTVPLP